MVKNLENHKAQGPDKIKNELIKNLPKEAVEHLCRIFNLSFKSGSFPPVWNNADIVPIPKPGKDHTKVTNYRPIAISSCLGRVFEKVLANRLQDWLTFNHIFHNLQCGFQANRACEDIITILLADAYACLDGGNTCSVISFDFQKAYDSVWHSGLIHKLYFTYGMRGNFLQTMSSFLSTRHIRVKSGNLTSGWKHQKIGLPQGSCLSPVLFILYTNDFKLPPEAQGNILVGTFADDTVMWQRPTPHPHRDRLLQESINKFYNYTLMWKLQLNPTKSAAINFSANIEEKQPEWEINKTKINNVDTMRYLGVWLDRKFTFEEHVKQVVRRASGDIAKLARLITNKFQLAPTTIVRLYLARTRPKIEYGLNLYVNSEKTLEKLNKIQNKFLRLAFRAARHTPIDILQMCSTVPPFELRRNLLLLRFCARLMYCNQYHPLYNHRYQVNTLWHQRTSRNLPTKFSNKLPIKKKSKN